MDENMNPEKEGIQNNTYMYTYTISYEKDIYNTPSLNANLDHNVLGSPLQSEFTLYNAFSAREVQLEEILSDSIKEPKTIMTKISQSEKEKILEKVFKYELSPVVQDFVGGYNRLYGKRSNFLWKWLGVVYRESGVALSTVDPKYTDSVTDTKILFTMLFSILDDTSEYYKDEKLMEDLLSILSNNFDKKKIEKNEQLMFFKKLWDYFQNEIKKYPRYHDLKDMFQYDLNQMMNSVRYCYLMNKKPEYINLQEMEIFGSYNMIVFILNGIDLLASPDFDKKDLPYLRTIFYNAQQMARIGNWLSTWKREIKEEDVSSGVFAYAFSNNIIHPDELKNLEEDEIIKRIENSGMLEYFIGSWKENYDNIKKYKKSIKSVDIDKYISGLENLIKLHLASEGFK
ncbi:MAG TPA: hypothetical protein ENI36_03755 [Thermoplasmatales archaeon]|nr:hypothetical protein [Thermoplasmatales archaeon]